MVIAAAGKDNLEELKQVDAECEEEDAEGASEQAEASPEIRRLGVGVFKQWCNAAGHLQMLQENLLFGQSVSTAITRQAAIKQDARLRKKGENERKEAGFEDAGNGKFCMTYCSTAVSNALA